MTSDREGRFVFDRIDAGSHDVAARGADGGEASASVTVPGDALDLVIAPGVAPRRRAGLSEALNRQTPCAASPAGLQLAARTTGNPLGGLRKLDTL